MEVAANDLQLRDNPVPDPASRPETDRAGPARATTPHAHPARPRRTFIRVLSDRGSSIPTRSDQTTPGPIGRALTPRRRPHFRSDLDPLEAALRRAGELRRVRQRLPRPSQDVDLVALCHVDHRRFSRLPRRSLVPAQPATMTRVACGVTRAVPSRTDHEIYFGVRRAVPSALLVLGVLAGISGCLAGSAPSEAPGCMELCDQTLDRSKMRCPPQTDLTADVRSECLARAGADRDECSAACPRHPPSSGDAPPEASRLRRP